MKVSNKGITLSETLCYIVIFSLLLSVIGGYLVFISKYNIKSNSSREVELTFLETICNNIYDYKFVNEEDLFIETNNRQELILKGVNTNQVYLTYNYQTKEMYNGLLGRSLCFEDIVLEIKTTSDYVYITNSTNNYHFIIEV